VGLGLSDSETDTDTDTDWVVGLRRPRVAPLGAMSQNLAIPIPIGVGTTKGTEFTKAVGGDLFGVGLGLSDSVTRYRYRYRLGSGLAATKSCAFRRDESEFGDTGTDWGSEPQKAQNSQKELGEICLAWGWGWIWSSANASNKTI
jgi:hypothetical protein